MHSRRVVSCPVHPGACHCDCVFRHNFSGMKRTCWTTGSWRCCLSLEVVSSIPTGSTIIHWFLCGFICVSLCQSIKIEKICTKYDIHVRNITWKLPSNSIKKVEQIWIKCEQSCFLQRANIYIYTPPQKKKMCHTCHWGERCFLDVVSIHRGFQRYGEGLVVSENTSLIISILIKCYDVT